MRDDKNRDLTKLPDLMGYLDIAALGTVADIVPLRGFNRTIRRLRADRHGSATQYRHFCANGCRSNLRQAGFARLGFALGPESMLEGELAMHPLAPG